MPFLKFVEGLVFAVQNADKVFSTPVHIIMESADVAFVASVPDVGQDLVDVPGLVVEGQGHKV